MKLFGVAALILLMLSGCAAWTGDLLSKEQLAGIAQHNVNVDYICRYSRNGTENLLLHSMVQVRVEETFKRTNALSGFTLGKGVTPYHLDFQLSENLDEGGAVISSLLTTASGLIIPACATAKLEMKVGLSKDGKLIKEYRYPNEIKRCVQLFLLFYPSEHGMDVGNFVIDDMISRFLLDAQKDGIL